MWRRVNREEHTCFLCFYNIMLGKVAGEIKKEINFYVESFSRSVNLFSLLALRNNLSTPFLFVRLAHKLISSSLTFPLKVQNTKMVYISTSGVPISAMVSSMPIVLCEAAAFSTVMLLAGNWGEYTR